MNTGNGLSRPSEVSSTAALSREILPVAAEQRFLPSRENSLVLVVDLQERLLAAMPEGVAARTLRSARILVQMAGEFGLPVAVSEQYPQGLGPTASELRAVLPGGTQPVEKVVFNCCAVPAFQPVLGGKDIILCGAETHVCVLQTALDLLAQGRRVYVAADATCSRAKLNWQLALDLMRQAGAVIGSAEIFAFGLLGAAGSETFKRISQMVK